MDTSGKFEVESNSIDVRNEGSLSTYVPHKGNLQNCLFTSSIERQCSYISPCFGDKKYHSNTCKMGLLLYCLQVHNRKQPENENVKNTYRC